MTDAVRRCVLLLFLLLGSASAAAGDYVDGLAAYVRGDYKTACMEFQELAEKGNPKAQLKLGEMHSEGQCGEKKEAEAVTWYTKAAVQGNPEAQIALALVNLAGKGTETKPGDAAGWLKKAAEQGDSTGQWLLGTLYHEGKGVEQNHVEAVKWLERSATQGNAVGQRILGESLSAGRGVTQDYVQAYKWLTLAFEKGESDALTARNGFASKMTAEQIEEGKKLAKSWRPQKGGVRK